MWQLTDAERRAMGIKPLPGARVAIEDAAGELVADVLGEHVFDFFLRNKRQVARLGTTCRASSSTYLPRL